MDLSARILGLKHRRSATGIGAGGLLSAGRRRRTAGQSLVELALLLPVLLTVFGAVIDLSRIYATQISLNSATRAAAEYATSKDTTLAAATADAQAIICQAMTGSSTCSDPVVTITNFTASAPPGGLASDGSRTVITLTITTSTSFHPLFAYPFLPGGGWPVGASATFSIIQG
jgi:Flp pilus assembly protein TadG